MKVKCLAIKAACLLGKCITGIIALGLVIVAYLGIVACVGLGGAWLFSVLPGLIQYAIVYIVGIIVLGLILMLAYFIGEDIFNKYNIKLCRKR
jgi:hypothetical protein